MRLARRVAEAHQLPDLPIVVVPHPVGGVPPRSVQEKAEGAVHEIVTELLGRAALVTAGVSRS